MNFFRWQLLLGTIFFCLSALFSATETALTSLSRPRLKKLIAKRPELALAFSEWLATPQYLLTTILVGNTLANVFATLLAVNLAFTWFPTVSHGVVETLTWLLMTVILFVFGEFVPKTLARHYPQRISLASIRLVSAISRWATPFLKAIIKFFDLFPAFEGEPVGKLSVYSLEELREMIQVSAEQGAVPRRSKEMMEAAMRLSHIPVSKIMTPAEHFASVNLGLDAEEVLDQAAEAGRNRVPVYRVDPKKIGGYLHAKDLLYVWRGALPLQLDALVRHPLFVPPDYMAANLLEDFRKGQTHMAIVTNTAGEAVGLVTLQDVLEEIVGEILDETPMDDFE